MKKKTSKNKLTIFIYGVVFVLLIIPVVIFCLFYYGEKTIPSYLKDISFNNETGTLICESTYNILVKDQENNNDSYYIGNSNTDINEYCNKKVTFTAKFDKFYGKPLCIDETSCPQKAPILQIENIQIKTE